jgi:hypothetical protein
MEIRNYQKGDEVKILDLFQQSFKKDMSLDYWRWRFIDNPADKIMIKLMWDNDVLAGHYAVSPVSLMVGNEQVLSALSMTTMTHPDYAGRGIFSELAETLYKHESEENDVKAVWGYPNLNSHYAFNKNLKWVNLDRIPLLSLSLAKLKSIACDEVSLVENFDEKHSLAYKEVTLGYEVKVKKDLSYLNWRYINNPENKYSIFQFEDNSKSYFAVTKLYRSFNNILENEIDIVEFNFPSDLNLLLKLLNKIKEFYSKDSVVKVNLWMPFDDPKHILLERIGFACVSPITFMGIRNLDRNLTMLENVKNWHYCMGDSDVY